MKYQRTARIAVVSVGIMALVSVAGMASAEESHGEGEVDVTVAIDELTQPGVLAMTVAGTSVALSESGSTDLVRQFTGTLPAVTVTDTRAAEEIPAGAGWYVLGTSTAFTGSAGQPSISADHLGWAPALTDGSDTGLVAEGDAVDTVMDTGSADAVGLVDKELLAMAIDSAAVAPEGQWTATANLYLRTSATVQPGSYTAQLTLSLFE